MPKIDSEISTQTFKSRSGMKMVEVPNEDVENYDYNDDGLSMESINERLRSRGMPPIDEQAYRSFQAQAAKQNIPVHEPKQYSLNEVEKQVAEARKFKATGRQRLSEAAKKRIEMLCGFSKNSRQFEMDGNTFTVRTLKNKEFREVLMAASLYDGTVQLPFETRKQILARSLTEVAGTDVDIFLGDSSLEAKLEFIDECDDRMLNKFYNEYLLLVEDINKKYALNTESDVQEVVADLKK